MSKASEYADKRPPGFLAPGLTGLVDLDGCFALEATDWAHRFRLSPETALRLGQWLIDTFGEKP